MIKINSDILKYNGVVIRNTAGITIPRGITAVIGANGSGKSSFARILQDGWNYMTNDIQSIGDHKPVVRTLAFSDIHSLSGFKTEYYQQRYESTMNEETPTVRSLFGTRLDSELWQQMASRLNLSGVESKRINFLSSGELRKLLIINALFDLPDLLVLDNPFIGLDAASRPVIDDALAGIKAGGTSVMVLVCDPADIPVHADTLIAMSDMMVVAEGSPADFTPESIGECMKPPRPIDVGQVCRLVSEVTHPRGGHIVDMRGCKVKYGNHVLVDNVDWSILGGECWALTGKNGSGKSTLLSLVNADNPQAYCNDISLFGRRRGSGESIWDIKDRIGYLSSELHLYFNGRLDSLRRVVGGGFSSFERVVSDAAGTDIDRWLMAFGMDGLADQRFNTLSYGQQRLALFIRALVKRPDLLILDEPMHGVDLNVKQAIRTIVEALAATGTTIIFVTHCMAELPQCVTNHFRLS